jgi:hypothetical protein
LVHVEEESENEAEAVGTGKAAEFAAAGVMAREEGRRYDTLLQVAIGSMAKACALHEKMAETLLARSVEDAKVQRSLLAAFRDATIAEAQTSADLVAAQKPEEKDPDSMAALIEQFGPMLMGSFMGGGAAAKKPQ